MQSQTWVPLAVAALGIGGVIWTQWRADARADKERERAREHETQLWARQDRVRTFEQRRQNYADFYRALRALVQSASARAHAHDSSDLPPDFGVEAAVQLELMDLYGTGCVPAAARRALDVVYSLAHSPGDPRLDEELLEFDYDHAEQELLNAIRADLGVPGQFAPPDPRLPSDRTFVADGHTPNGRHDQPNPGPNNETQSR